MLGERISAIQESQAMSKNRICRPAFTVSVLALAGACFLWPMVQEAREAARTAPVVHISGNGSGTAFGYVLIASGEPTEEVQRRATEAIRRLVPNLIEREEERKGQGYPYFVSLTVNADQLSDEAMAALGNCTQGLDALSLEDVEVSSTGIRSIARIDSLQSLNLRNSRINDSTLRELATLTALRHLDLRDNDVSLVAVRELEETIPNCRIVQ